MKTRDYILSLAILGIIVIAVKVFVTPVAAPTDVPVGAGTNFFYNSAEHATSSIGAYVWTEVLAASSGRGYAALCNNSITANDAMYLYFGTASTTALSPAKPNGFRLPSGECYEMTLDKMFYGSVYAIASTATTTLLRVQGSY